MSLTPTHPPATTGGPGKTKLKNEPTPRRDGDLRRTLRLFGRYMGDRRVYILALVLLIIEAATAVIEPYPIAYLVDYLQRARESLRDLGFPAFLTSERTETLLLLTVAILGIAAINSAADSMTEVYTARGGRQLGYSIRVAMYKHLQHLSLAYYDRKRTGDVLTRVTGDVLVLEEFIVKSASNIVGSLLVLFGSFALLIWQSWTVALVAIIVVRCSPSSRATTRSGSRRRRRPSAPARASWPPRRRR